MTLILDDIAKEYTPSMKGRQIYCKTKLDQTHQQHLFFFQAKIIGIKTRFGFRIRIFSLV